MTVIVSLLCAVRNKNQALKVGGLDVLLSSLKQVFSSSHSDCQTDLTICLIRSIDLLLAEFRMYF